MDRQELQVTPVTMLSGFLGAGSINGLTLELSIPLCLGKTTLLKHILENSTNKIACLVNDLASVNIDAKLVRNAGRTEGSALSDMVELQNGCCCCSAADELFPAFAELLRAGDQSGQSYERYVQASMRLDDFLFKKPYYIAYQTEIEVDGTVVYLLEFGLNERIILENSGVAEPQNIRDSFNEAFAMGHPITSRIQLEGLITVVDAVTFISDFASKAPMSLRPDLGDGGGNNYRPVVDLLVEQIECADLIVLNKADVAEPDKIERLIPIMTSLNPLAHVVHAIYGKIPLEMIQRSGIASKMNIEAQHRSAIMAAKEHKHHHGHDHEHGHVCDEHCTEDGHHHHHQERSDPGKKYGIASFVYLRRKPFHPYRLRQLVLRWLPATSNTALDGMSPATGDSPIKRVLRSKGFSWLANAHASAFYWSHAGQHFELREEGDWWASVDPKCFPPNPCQRQTIYQDFDGTFGDRRQEIVFIGADMNEGLIVEQLDAALLTDEEMQQYTDTWSSIRDPQHPDVDRYKNLCPPSAPSHP